MEIVVKIEGDPDLTAVVGGEIRFYNPDLDEYEMRDVTLGDLVASKIADKILGTADRDWRHELFNQIRAQRTALVKEKVGPEIEAALAGPIRKTNTFGEPTGDEVTLRELIVAEALKLVQAKPNTRTGGDPTLLQQVIRDEVNAALRKELVEAIAQAKAEMVKAVRTKAAEYLSEAVLARTTKVSPAETVV